MTMNNQSKATRKYEAKAGWISKSYKLKKDIVEQFSEACQQKGVSQAGALMDFMKKFIEENK